MLDQAADLEQLAREVADLRADVKAAQVALLEAQIMPGSMARMAAGDTPSGTTGTGAYAPTTILGNGVVTEGTIATGAITGGKIAAGAVEMSKFASGIVPPQVVSSLPTLPDAAYPAGSLVFLTSDSCLYKTTTGLADSWTKMVDAGDIIEGSITAGQIAAGAIGADELAATIILGSLIKTSDTGKRVEIDSAGIRAIDGDGYLMVKIPTNADPVYIYAGIQASYLNLLDYLTLTGANNQFAPSSVVTLAASVNNPSAAPELDQTYDQTSIPTASQTWTTGCAYDAAGGAGGATKVFWGVLGDYTIGEYLCSDRTLNRSKVVDATSDYVRSVCRLGSYVYALYWDFSASAWKVRRFAVSDLALNATYSSVSFPAATTPSGADLAMSADGTYIYIADVADADSHLLWNKYDATMVKQGSTIDSGYVHAGPRAIYTDSADFGAWRMAVVGYGVTDVNVFDSTGARQATQEWAVAGTMANGIAYGDALGTGARFFSHSLSDRDRLWAYTNWVWTTESAVYWAAYSWYDSVATTHETQCGPRASITMNKRARLDVTCAPIPGGEVDNHRLYMERGATDPGLTNLKLQATFATDGTSLSTFDTGGAADPGSNTFGAGTPAEVKSATAGWSLKGDGTTEFADHPRFVPFAQETIASSVDGQTSAQTVTCTSAPSDGTCKAVSVVAMYRRNADTTDEYLQVLHYSGEIAGVTWTSGVTGRGGGSSVSYVETGGTGNRQFKWVSSDAGSDNDIWLYAVGYWSTV